MAEHVQSLTNGVWSWAKSISEVPSTLKKIQECVGLRTNGRKGGTDWALRMEGFYIGRRKQVILVAILWLGQQPASAQGRCCGRQSRDGRETESQVASMDDDKFPRTSLVSEIVTWY